MEDWNEKDNKVRKKPKWSRGSKIVFILLCALAVGGVAGFVWNLSGFATEINIGSNYDLAKRLEKDTYVNKEPLEETKVLSNVDLENDVTKVVEDNMPCTVSITCQVESQEVDFFGQYQKKIEEGAGSGFIMGEDSTNYYISTNNHVVAGARKITVTFSDGKDAEASLKGTDSTGDLAVVAVKKKALSDDTKKAVKVAKLGDSNQIKVGETVVAIGNALGLGQSCTVGVVSAVNREVTVDNVTMKLLQTDTAINFGNSGGALLNLQGEVVGINSVKFVDKTIEGMCFSIPISHAQSILDELMSAESFPEGSEGYLGLSGLTITQEESKALNFPVGVYVKEVPKGGAADKAGLLKGDIITKMNNVSVATIESLQERATSYKAGTKITLTIQRYENGAYQEKVLNLKLMSKNDFGGLKYSEGTVTDNGNSGEGQVPEEGENGR